MSFGFNVFFFIYFVLCFFMIWKPAFFVKINEKFLVSYWKLFGYEITIKKISSHRAERIAQLWALACVSFALFVIIMVNSAKR